MPIVPGPITPPKAAGVDVFVDIQDIPSIARVTRPGTNALTRAGKTLFNRLVDWVALHPNAATCACVAPTLVGGVGGIVTGLLLNNATLLMAGGGGVLLGAAVGACVKNVGRPPQSGQVAPGAMMGARIFVPVASQIKSTNQAEMITLSDP